MREKGIEEFGMQQLNDNGIEVIRTQLNEAIDFKAQIITAE